MKKIFVSDFPSIDISANIISAVRLITKTSKRYVVVMDNKEVVGLFDTKKILQDFSTGKIRQGMTVADFTQTIPSVDQKITEKNILKSLCKNKTYALMSGNEIIDRDSILLHFLRKHDS